MSYHTLQCWLTKTQVAAGGVVEMGLLPAESLALNPYLVVTEAFNAAGTDVIRIGTSTDDDAFGTDKDVSSLIVAPTNFTAGTGLGYYSTGTRVFATYSTSSGSPTLGQALLILPFLRVRP